MVVLEAAGGLGRAAAAAGGGGGGGGRWRSSIVPGTLSRKCLLHTVASCLTSCLEMLCYSSIEHFGNLLSYHYNKVL